MKGTIKRGITLTGLVANNSSRTATSSNETASTFLEERNVIMLLQMFDTPQNSARHIRCLWVLRELVEGKIGNVPNPSEHELFPLLHTINELIGCLTPDGVHFDNKGRAYTFQEGKQVFI
jgi:hypothetical protein